MSKVRKITRNWRVLILIAFLIFSLLVIGHQKAEGVIIKGVEENSDAFNSGISNPIDVQPTQLERILKINNIEISSIEDYSELINSINLNGSIRIVTNKNEYIILKTSEDIGLSIGKRAGSNIRKGLELQGGTRVLLKPEDKASDSDIQDVIEVMQKRLNVYGLSDLSIKSASDLLGNKYIVVEIAGATKEEVKELIAKQGVFEAKINESIVFKGGEKDVTYVCRNDGTCSGIRACNPSGEGYNCQFEFQISITPEAAKRFGDATNNLDIINDNGDRYLSEKIVFFLDGKEVDSLNIDADLKGQAVTNILISGPGIGNSQQEAVSDANENMKKIQTVLITGSLPTKLEIIKLDSISPSLGESFVKNALLTGFLAIFAVGIVIFIRYRKLKIAIPMLIGMLSEIYIILGLAALVRWNLDLAAIAGIIASVGTGVDDQVVIADEVLNKEVSYNLKERIKKAFFIIFVAYFTTVVAMIPLLKAGAGLLTGFAFVTIAGVSIGVFITRPAFANVIRILFED